MALDFRVVNHFSILALILLKGIPESKDESAHNKKFDIIGIIILSL